MNTETQDFYFAVYLSINGVKPNKLEPCGNRKMFVFKDSPLLRELRKQYYTNNASVNPLEYKNEIRKLKNLVLNI